jgi:hypothetical protein
VPGVPVVRGDGDSFGCCSIKRRPKINNMRVLAAAISA